MPTIFIISMWGKQKKLNGKEYIIGVFTLKKNPIFLGRYRWEGGGGGVTGITSNGRFPRVHSNYYWPLKFPRLLVLKFCATILGQYILPCGLIKSHVKFLSKLGIFQCPNQKIPFAYVLSRQERGINNLIFLTLVSNDVWISGRFSQESIQDSRDSTYFKDFEEIQEFLIIFQRFQ